MASPSKKKKPQNLLLWHKKLDLDSKKLEPRVLGVLLTGSEQIQKETSQGLPVFYDKVESICQQGGTAMWEYATAFSNPIRNVGVAHWHVTS